MSRRMTSRSARRVRSPSGSGLENDTSVLSPRWETARPLLANSSASRAACTIACSCTAAQPAPSSVRTARQGCRERLGAQRERVEASAVLVQPRVEPCPRVEQVSVAATAHLQALSEGRGDVEHAEAVWSAQPLLSGTRVGIAAERAHVYRHGPDSLGAVEHDGHLQLRQLRRRQPAAHPAHVRARHQPCALCHRLGDACERDRPNRDAAQRACGPERAEQARVLFLAREDLIALAQPQAVDHA